MQKDTSAKSPTLPPPKVHEPNVDPDRLNYYKLLEASREEEKPEDKLKKVINPNLFREEVRRQQR